MTKILDLKYEHEKFRLNLIKYRKKREYTQEELGGLCGYHRTYICALESGRANPTLDTILRLAWGLQIDACHLLIQTRERLGERLTKKR